MTTPLHKPYLNEEEEQKVLETLRSGKISQSVGKVEKFERKIRDFLEVNHGTSTDSGTAALRISLEALGVEDGDEVIIPGLTFGATALAVKQLGAKPIPVDIEEERLGINPDELREAITPDTAAVLVVHLLGIPAKMNKIMEVAEENNIPVIEDSAQAFGSSLKGQKTGTIADIGVFSFSWNKNITTGKGGFICTDDPELGEKIETLVRNGAKNERKFRSKGFNYRMDSTRAAIGLAQLTKYDEIRRKKEAVFEKYHESLREVEEVKTKELFSSDPWTFTVFTEKRDDIRKVLEEHEIESRAFYPPVTDLGCVNPSKSLPVSRKYSKTGLMLPSYVGLEHKDIEKIVSIIDEYF